MIHQRGVGILTAALATLLAVGGCGSRETAPSSSPGSDDVTSRDTIECMSVARVVRATPQGPRTTIDQDRYQQCMAARGHVGGPAR